mgnify:CR=1 FL=1
MISEVADVIVDKISKQKNSVRWKIKRSVGKIEKVMNFYDKFVIGKKK